MRRRSAFALAFSAAAVFAPVRAQQPDDPPPPPNLYTLHVYTNLMQFPTIVLGPDLRPMKPVPLEKFNISIDGGAIFHPTKIRIEGDDPISLAVLLDAAGEQSGALRNFAQNFAQLFPGSLHPQDRVSVYAVDCKLMRTLKDVPAADPETIAKGITTVLEGPGLHGEKTKPTCGYQLHLWDAVNVVAHDLGGLPGRHVLLIVSQGHDIGSKQTIASVSDYLTRSSIAVFALRDSWEYGKGPTLQSAGNRGRSATFGDINDSPDPLAAICANNGGLILDTEYPGVAKDLQHVVELLRGRYIIEYPRPDDKQPIVHSLDITIAGVDAFVRPTGDSSPIPDPAIANAPNTLPSTPSPAKVGNHRPRNP